MPRATQSCLLHLAREKANLCLNLPSDCRKDDCTVRRLHAAARRSNTATTNVPFPKLKSALMRGDRFTKPRWLYLPLKAAIMQKDGVAELNAGQRTPARSGGRTQFAVTSSMQPASGPAKLRL